MKLTFESDLLYQLDAIKSVVNLFEGQPAHNAIIEFELQEETPDLINAVANNLIITCDQIFTNLKTIQQSNNIELTQALNDLNFSVEMETGTGKTYVYLRTIYELNKLYGFKKFVIVVPSIAIREGVLKNLAITHTHFQNLYDNTPINFQIYDSTKVSLLRGFATNNNIEILVINIDSFAKDENIINKANDRLQGQKPIEFIQATNPFVIVDEPQNMETEKRQKALGDLNPLCTFRYSATHKNKYNLVYSLNPVKAYDLGLVKQIEVDSIITENAFNDAFILVEQIVATKTKVMAKIVISSNEKNGVKNKSVTIKIGDDLYKLSGYREIYRDGYLIEGIDVNSQCISISNGNTIYKGETLGSLTDDIIKFQLKKTIEEHLKKEKQLNKLGIKVLSLFFIDKVANYRSYDKDGQTIKGKLQQWFEQIYIDYIATPAFQELNRFSIESIHNGYFSQDSKGKLKDTNGVTLADYDTYNLIMKDKEKLLQLDNPLRFIFSHSALREGWDNPNVFQICTLNETKSEIKKRQEIGRGLRLCVDQQGKRIYDQDINRLTLITNESYDDFAKSLQKEIEEDCGVKFDGKIKNARDRKLVKYRNGFAVDPQFLAIWGKIKDRTTYRVNYATEKLITLSAEAIKKMPMMKAPSLRATKVSIVFDKTGASTLYRGDKIEKVNSHEWGIPDVLSYIQSKTELTRSTINAIIVKSGRVDDILINPQLFLDLASLEIKRAFYRIMIDGIKYQKIGESQYAMALFESQELETYLNDFSFKVEDTIKTIYEDFIPLDSGIEHKFSQDCETSEQIKFYFKLPSWFKIPTPIGNYNPDWAIVFENDSKIYFVVETKDTGTASVDMNKLTIDEQLKIECAKAHFKQFDDLKYHVVSKVEQLSTFS